MYSIGIFDCSNIAEHIIDTIEDLINDRIEVVNSPHMKIVSNSQFIINKTQEMNLTGCILSFQQMLNEISEIILIDPNEENANEMCPILVEKKIKIIPLILQMNVNSE